MFKMDEEYQMLAALMGSILFIMLVIIFVVGAFDIYKTKMLIGAANGGKITLNLNLNGDK